MPPRFFIPLQLAAGQCLELTPAAAQHARVLRLQPQAPVVLFNGQGGEWRGQVTRMGRSTVTVAVEAYVAVEREAGRSVHLASGLLLGERMDWLLEKATELGVASMQPIVSARVNRRLDDARVARQLQRWQVRVAAACEQCGRNRLPQVHAPLALPEFIARPQAGATWLLSLAADARPFPARLSELDPSQSLTLLCGPEGGFAPEEEEQARAAGFRPVSLANRTLCAETAALAALALATAH